MGLTISQSPSSANLYLYPNGTYTYDSDFKKYGESTFYECVDEIWHSPNDDTDYVYSTATTNQQLWLHTQDHTTETGTINYVRVISRAKSYQIQQSNNGIYAHWIYDGTSGVYSSNFAPLTTTYTKYYSSWNTKPSGGGWTWNDIDNLKIGIKCSSPSITSTYTATLRPNEYLAGSEVVAVGDTPANKCVDDVISDEDETYVRGGDIQNSNWESLFARFGMSDMSTPYYNYTISKVKLFHRARASDNDAYKNSRGDIKVDDTYSNGTARTNTLTYTTWSDTFSSNPSGANWTIDDVNKLEARICMRQGSIYRSMRFTQVYATVNYTINDSPEIRTTQLYAVVNYNPPASTVTLDTITNLNVSHTVSSNVLISLNAS